MGTAVGALQRAYIVTNSLLGRRGGRGSAVFCGDWRVFVVARQPSLERTKCSELQSYRIGVAIAQNRLRSFAPNFGSCLLTMSARNCAVPRRLYQSRK
jgi:hypothetical protein